jgi:hypothetical protein
MNRTNDLLRRAMISAVGPVVALAVMAGPVLAAGPEPKPLSLTKECSKFTAHSGDFCSITASSLDLIPVGAKVFYYGPVIGPAILSTAIVLDAGEGNTAIGYCNVDLPKSAGACTFWAGSGTLTGFQALVNLTVDSTGLFHWDGSYSLGDPAAM